MKMKDYKIIRDYSELFEDLRKCSIKHNISFTKLSFLGFWDGGCYNMSQYGIIQLKDEINI